VIRATESCVGLVTDAALLAEFEDPVRRDADELGVDGRAIEVDVVRQDPGLVDIEACLVRRRIGVRDADGRDVQDPEQAR
jgi:hypothetical protein